MKYLILDIEGNGLLSPHVEKDGTITNSVNKIHCVCVHECNDINDLKLKLTKEFDSPQLGATVPITKEDVKVFYTAYEFQSYLDSFDGEVAICGHNILQYDIPALMAIWNIDFDLNSEILGTNPRRRVTFLDTLIFLKLLANLTKQREFSLKALSKKFFPDEVGKEEYDGGWETCTTEMVDYCKGDVLASVNLVRLAIAAKNQATKVDPWGFNSSIQYFSDCFVRPPVTEQDKLKQTYGNNVGLESVSAMVLSAQEIHGIAFNIKMADDYMHVLVKEAASIDDDLQKVFPPIATPRVSKKTGKKLKDSVEIFNPGSRQHIAKRLATLYPDITWEQTEKGNDIVDKTALGEYNMYPECVLLARHFKVQKKISYLSDWIQRAKCDILPDNPDIGVIHHHCNPAGTYTWRCSHSQPNLGQVDNDPLMRAMFIPRPGLVMVGADLKSLEYRLFAHYLYPFDNGVFVDIVENKDIHTENTKAFGLPPDQRKKGKEGGFAILYGAGPKRISEVFKCTYMEAREFISKFKMNTKGYQELSDSIMVAMSNSGGYIKGIDNRFLWPEATYSALNTLLQGGGAVVAKAWMTLVSFEVDKRKLKAKQLLFVHDEIQYECPPDEVEELKKILVDKALEVTDLFSLKCPIRADACHGFNWASTH